MPDGAYDSLLALNCGSSSIKFALFTPDMERTLSGLVEAIGHGQTPRLILAGAEAAPFGTQDQGHADLLPRLIEEIILPRAGAIGGIGHRVVHGGELFTTPIAIDASVRSGIATLAPLAPGHQPHNLAGINAAMTALPGVLQVACFDTAFHASVPPVRREMPLPRAYARQGLIRYGFHGLSYEHVATSLSRLGVSKGRVVACHLGNGSSICGMIDGTSRWTSMGFTPLDGLMMGQRPGRLDPGAVLWLLDHFGGDAEKLSKLLYHQSGLSGVSGISGDMRALLASHEPDAAFAIEMYVDRLVAEIGAAAASLEGIDALVFSGGIGENSAPIRASALVKLEWLGFALDPDANAAQAERLTASNSARHAFIVKADEELVIARAVAQALAG
ncbi:MAG: acetate/propionate family kinase [Hoeflea sp.]|uniref:acetate/propionate family kinase n=1 Tax=Hoeflea sp. TaxID=1940281 RepID=UPI001E092151|nr:acetate/propionate family kinase [Hoeflea sp.]MBU4528140.1 acetate/propionate family kinase [Alphaproteobacteria bacterium]MBU4543736.1 acetate/propionate family kinase [Alphaproteobacteria bacterium]MBU4548603.1 acetate/propionate family kinase [Alphaproteobacteria bacterium]MBV1725769.1 acetate/propionate family kinase [Hoeflea sp.]MBV1762125.1 acetate/propionate family kinase [Hoeflea sp.]